MSEMRAPLPPRPETPYLPDRPEWDNLVADNGNVHVSVEAGQAATNPYAEYNRTLATLHAFDNLVAHMDADHPEAQPEDFIYDRGPRPTTEEEAYEAFTAGQRAGDKLPFGKYQELSDTVNEVFNTPRKVRNMQYVLLVSDACKKEDLMRAVDLDPHDSHDQGLVRMFTDSRYADALRRYFPSFDNPALFDDEDRHHIRSLVSLMGFNLPGWAQSQSTVGHLEQLPEDTDQATKEQFLIHGMLDVMGVLGNRSLTSALAWAEATHDMFMQAYAALTARTAEDLNYPDDIQLTPALRENAYLAMRANYYGEPAKTILDNAPPLDAFNERLVSEYGLMRDMLVARQQAIPIAELRARVRLANEGRFKQNDERFTTLRNAFNARSEVHRARLTDTLVGHSDAYFPMLSFADMADQDYGPAFAAQLLQGDEAAMGRGLAVIEQVFAAAQHVGNKLYSGLNLDETTGKYEPGRPFPALLIQCKQVVAQMKEPGFDPYQKYVAIDVVDNTLIPRFTADVSESPFVQ